MFTNILLQQIEVAHLESKRRDQELCNEQLRIARMDRPSTMTLIAHRIGTMLISLGERLHRDPAPRTGVHLERFNATRAA